MSKRPDDKLVSHALHEVWRWKEKVAQEHGGLDSLDLIRRMNEDAERIVRENNLSLPRYEKHSYAERK